MTTFLTPKKFDGMIDRKGSKIIWTASAIGARIGRSEQFVRKTLAHLPGTPVRKVGGRLCAAEDALADFVHTSFDR